MLGNLSIINLVKVAVIREHRIHLRKGARQPLRRIKNYWEFLILNTMDDNTSKFIIETAAKASFEILGQAFYLCKLETHIHQYIINDANGDEFVLKFDRVKNGNNLVKAKKCDSCQDGIWLRKNTKCLICGKVKLDGD